MSAKQYLGSYSSATVCHFSLFSCCARRGHPSSADSYSRSLELPILLRSLDILHQKALQHLKWSQMSSRLCDSNAAFPLTSQTLSHSTNHSCKACSYSVSATPRILQSHQYWALQCSSGYHQAAFNCARHASNSQHERSGLRGASASVISAGLDHYYQTRLIRVTSCCR